MVTIKEYKKMMESATDSRAVGGMLIANIENMLSGKPDEKGWFENLSDVELRISRDEAKYIQQSDLARDISPELIRVIELAENALKKLNPIDYGMVDIALSEIKKLKG